MNLKFIFFIALRYLKARKKSRKISSSVLLILCLALGVMALTVVIGIMNGFQLTFIEPILNISSFHIQISGDNLSPEKLAAVRTIPGITACIPFCEYQGLINGKNACLIRGIPADIQDMDSHFKDSFKTRDTVSPRVYDVPDFRLLSSPGTIVLGNLLEMILNTEPGESVSVLTLTGNPIVTLEVSGTFKTGYDDIDTNWGFISLETAALFEAKGTPPGLKYGVKLANRFNDSPVMSQLKKLLGSGYKIQSWRVFNSKFFNALFTEKIMMSVILGLIFIIVAFGIFHSLRRSVHEKIEEIALLKALGASSMTIKNIFITEGFLLGLIGVMAGTILGLLVGYNINTVFRLTELVVNQGVFPVLEGILAPFTHSVHFTPVSIFSPEVYYIDQVPVRVLIREAVFVNVFAVACCVIAAWSASRKIADFKPAIVLRYE